MDASATPPSRRSCATSNHVADRFDLRRDIELPTRASPPAALGRRRARRWQLEPRTTELRIARRASASWPPAACRAHAAPPFPGDRDVRRATGTTPARWPHEGRGLHRPARRRHRHRLARSSSPIPRVAEQAAHGCHVFQRTPNFSMPARTQPLDPDTRRALKSGYRERRRLPRESLSGVPSFTSRRAAAALGALAAVTPEERTRVYEDGWTTGGIGGVTPAFNDIITDAEANATAADFVREKIRGLVRDNVTLVDVRDAPIVRLTPRGVQTASAEYDLDVIIFATGFSTRSRRRPTLRTPGSRTSTRSRRRHCPRARTPGTRAPNIPGKPRVFMPYVGGVAAYRAHCDAVAESGYDGFSVAAGPGSRPRSRRAPRRRSRSPKSSSMRRVATRCSWSCTRSASATAT